MAKVENGIFKIASGFLREQLLKRHCYSVAAVVYEVASTLVYRL